MTRKPVAATNPHAAAPVGPGVCGRFVEAVVARDFPALAACFALDARFRALVPRGVREGAGPEDSVRWFQRWFGGADRVDVLERGVTEVADRVHMTWRLRVAEGGETTLIEQQAYATVRDGMISELDLLCSGFRLEATADARSTKPATDAPTRAAAHLDGGDAGCANLTPLIKAALRDLESGQVLEIVSSEPTAAQDLASWSALSGHAIVETHEDGESRHFYVRKK